MKTRMILAAGTLGALLSSPAFADDTSVAATAEAPKMRVAAQVELLPLGSGKTSVGEANVSLDTELAYGISAAFDYAVTPYLSIGVAPRLVLNVAPKTEGEVEADEDDPDTEIDLRARIVGHYPVAKGLEVFAALSPGYTIVLNGAAEGNNGKGFALGGSLGLTYDVSPKLFVGGEIGYQRAFTSTDVMVGTETASLDVDLSYMHIGLGAGTRF